MLGEGSLLEKIVPTAFERLEMIPSEVDLCGADIELALEENHLQRLALADGNLATGARRQPV